ncbi:MAG: hypothetical protein ACOY16_01630 [Chloroflexota bacterium]
MKKASKIFLTIILSLTALCFGLLLISALRNFGLPQAFAHRGTLDENELARQAELFHLRREVGNQVWLGWGAAGLPAITYNEGYAFLRLVFPFRLFIGRMLGGDDKHISAAAHESFHAWHGLASLQKFSAAETAARRWSASLNPEPIAYEQQGEWLENEDDGRFCCSGMAQAYLLDRLLPGWKERTFDDDVWLKTLQAEALKIGN